MKILHFGIFAFDDTVFSILTGFRNLGHQVETCHIIQAENTLEIAEEAINRFKPDMVVTIGVWYDLFDSETLWGVIRKHNIPHIYWAIEDPVFFDCISTVHIDQYDFVFTTSRECVKQYNALGKKAAYLPFCCNPEVHKRVNPVPEYTSDIAVLSNFKFDSKYAQSKPERYEFRVKCYRDLVEPLIKNDYDIKLYGFGWDDESLSIPEKFFGRDRYVMRYIVPSILSSVKMVMIIQWDYEGHICYKTYEALGCKCFQIAPYTPVQAEYFINGEHLVYSNSPEDTLRLVDYYLSHEKKREEIVKMGQEEAYKKHNCTLRAKTALTYLENHGFDIDFIKK